jgi:hypothetical protein
MSIGEQMALAHEYFELLEQLGDWLDEEEIDAILEA